MMMITIIINNVLMLEGQKGKKTNSKLWSFRKLEPARSHYELGLGNSWTAVIYS